MKLIIANMKMNFVYSDIKEYKQKLEENEFLNQLIIAPATVLAPYFLSSKYKVAIQNLSNEDNGAFTGEVSTSQVKSLGINYAILGHSERRTLFLENDELINKKTKKAIESDITPIVCIGETLQEKNKKKAKKVLKNQLSKIENKNDVIFAYEPLWSIGTGKIPTEKELKDTAEFIKGIIPENKLLYGGSVKAENIEFLESLNAFDGYLIGGASLKAENLIEIDKLIGE